MRFIFGKAICKMGLFFLTIGTYSSGQTEPRNPFDTGELDSETISESTFQSIQITPITLDTGLHARYARSYQDFEGNVYIHNFFKISIREDLQPVIVHQTESLFPPAALKEGAMNTCFARPGFFIALGYQVMYQSDSTFITHLWQSSDNLKTTTQSQARFFIPEAGQVDYGTNGEWAGLFCHRGIIQCPDGSLLAAMYGNFESDTIIPSNPQSKLETKYKLRAFIVHSSDSGKTWRYVSSLAIPCHQPPDDSEGFNEWNMVQLQDGRILAVIRTGHFTPPVLTYSTDQGLTWSAPEANAELGPAACDPCLLKLADGRIALSPNKLVPAAEKGAYGFCRLLRFMILMFSYVF